MNGKQPCSTDASNAGKYGSHFVRLYYEDCDHSGAVYHPNYLKYFERAREHLLGPDVLVRLWDAEGLGFVVTKLDLSFRVSGRLRAETPEPRAARERRAGRQ